MIWNWILGFVGKYANWLWVAAVTLLLAAVVYFDLQAMALSSTNKKQSEQLQQASDKLTATTAAMERTQKQLSEVAATNRNNEDVIKQAEAARAASAALAQAARTEAQQWETKWREAREKLAATDPSAVHAPDPVFCTVVDSLYDPAQGPACPTN